MTVSGISNNTRFPRKQVQILSGISLLATAMLSQTLYAHTQLPEVNVEEKAIAVGGVIEASEFNATLVDSAAALATMPGASVTRNGPLTGIVQYRGLQGDRISVSVDSGSVATGGPNAMDAPLSYVPAKLLKEIHLSRGVASVLDGQETFGGHVHVVSERGEFGDGSEFSQNGFVSVDVTGQNSGLGAAALAALANESHKLSLSSSYDEADDSEFSDGKISGTEYLRRRHNLMYDFSGQSNSVSLTLGKNNTGDSGTPALAMDILSIDTDIAQFETTFDWLGIEWQLASSYSDVDHLMTNFHLRTNPNPMAHRVNHATGDRWHHKLVLEFPIADGTLNIGADYSRDEHDSEINNPNGMLRISNFNGVEREVSGLFAQWQRDSGAWFWSVGARANEVEMDADSVGAFSLPMMMMQMNANALAQAFNDADRSSKDNNRDLVAKAAYRLSNNAVVYIGVSSKQRSPSYQQRFLWLPLAATGGLADGRNYVGNLDLKPETANEFNIGVDRKFGAGYLSAHGFYREIDDYIQGGAANLGANTMAANMIAAMMNGSGENALQFQNVDARIYGGELGYGYQFTANFKLDGQLSYSRGERRDVSDDLYRLAPLRHGLTLSYGIEDWSAWLTSELVASQKKVAEFNGEQETSGYGLVHIGGHYQIGKSLMIRASIDNLLDKRYSNHLAGINRVSDNNDLPVGERLVGTGRSFNAGIEYRW